MDALKRKEAKRYTKPDGEIHVKKIAPNTQKKTVRRSFLGTRIFYTCPRCGKPLQYKRKMHQGLCMNCGQRLDWSDYDDMACVWLEVHDAEEAGYWGGQYSEINGTLYGIDYEKWRLSMTRKRYPMILFFPFPYGKDYGRFMRKASKEATIIKDICKGGGL